jgi:SAM-dependent methyltransferase
LSGKTSNKEIYSTQELECWAQRANEDLIPAEKYLINKYLINKNARVMEAGTGGGRIAFNIEEMGFSNIVAFDYVPEMIDYAKNQQKIRHSNIQFSVADASDLEIFGRNVFDYLIYLQQIICFIPESLIEKALIASYTIASEGAVAIFSFLLWEGRSFNPFISVFVNLFRLLRGEPLSRQSLPWLRFNQKFNRAFLKKGQATNYWVKKEEIISLIKRVGYSIIEIKTTGEILNLKNKNYGMLYIVCKK